MRLTPHLYFRGDCEEALKFYAAAGLGKIIQLRRYGDSSPAQQNGASWGNKVEHAWFEGLGIRLFACDGPNVEPMQGLALTIEHEAFEAAQHLFVALTEGGRTTVPFQRQPWGEFYGAFTDRFGMQWAVTAPESR